MNTSNRRIILAALVLIAGAGFALWWFGSDERGRRASSDATGSGSPASSAPPAITQTGFPYQTKLGTASPLPTASHDPDQDEDPPPDYRGRDTDAVRVLLVDLARPHHEVARDLSRLALSPQVPLPTRMEAMEHALNLAEPEDLGNLWFLLDQKDVPDEMVERLVTEAANFHDPRLQLILLRQMLDSPHDHAAGEARELLAFLLEAPDDIASPDLAALATARIDAMPEDEGIEDP